MAEYEYIGKINDVFPDLKHAKISYAQQGEDLILRRILTRKLKLPVDKGGVYVDVGAYHPTNASITKFLYDLGWVGVIVDMSQDCIREFAKSRPRDKAFHTAVGSENATITGYFNEREPHINTISLEHKESMERYGVDYQEQTVHVRKLDDILEDAAISEIDFLNIDVEGHEIEVLKGFSIDKYNPKCIAIELHCKNIEDIFEMEEYKLLSLYGYKLVASACITHFFTLQKK